MYWYCFDARDVELGCLEFIVDKNKNGFIATVFTRKEGVDHTYSLPIDFDFECKETLYKWEKLMDGANEICMMGAKTRSMSNEVINYDIYKLKTDIGNWDTGYFSNIKKHRMI
ncbi:MAG: hypothetical protein N4A33_00905 [Bacteriovoracaceae bacterium]|jgi:hypothetical protein|nr:hypothetical protein [Bacteriovoracaceae bacterium]